MANYYIVALAEIMKNKAVNATVQIVDPADPAGEKSRPLIGMNMMVAGLISLMVSMVIALFLEKRGKRRC